MAICYRCGCLGKVLGVLRRIHAVDLLQHPLLLFTCHQEIPVLTSSPERAMSLYTTNVVFVPERISTKAPLKPLRPEITVTTRT